MTAHEDSEALRNRAPDELVAAIAAEPKKTASPDSLVALRLAVVRQLRLTAQVEELEEATKRSKQELLDIAHRELPDLFEACGVDVVGIAEGYDAKLEPYYRANIAADWPDGKRDAAFAALIELGGADLVKTIVTIEFGKTELEKYEELAEVLSDMGIGYSSRQGVPWQSLTAFVKEQVEAGNAKLLGYLETLGATVGKIVRLKEKKG